MQGSHDSCCFPCALGLWTARPQPTQCPVYQFVYLCFFSDYTVSVCVCVCVGGPDWIWCDFGGRDFICALCMPWVGVLREIDLGFTV